jgi:WD40 repeat protein
MIATCSDDSTISIWDADDGRCLLGPFDCNVGAVLSIAFSRDGKVLISGNVHPRATFFLMPYVVVLGNNDGTVRSWALNTPIVGQLNPLSTYRGHTGPVRTVAYARMGDSERIVSGSDDAEIAIWDGDSDRLVRKICGHDAAVLSISVSGHKAFSSSRDKTIRVWDLDTGDNISIICGHTAPINEIKLSPDERWVVSASDDGSLRIWDSHSQTGKPLTLPLSMPFRILSVDISRDGNLITCAGADGQVHAWRPDLAQPAVWPDSLMRRMHGREYCPVDDQGILVDVTLRSDGWLCGPMGQIMCWIPPAHRQGLLLQRAVSIVGARETALDLRNFAHGTNWEQCVAN